MRASRRTAAAVNDRGAHGQWPGRATCTPRRASSSRTPAMPTSTAIPIARTFFTTSNLALPAEEFRALGGFDERFVASEDRELCGRWEAMAARMVYEPDVVVHHSHDLTLVKLLPTALQLWARGIPDAAGPRAARLGPVPAGSPILLAAAQRAVLGVVAGGGGSHRGVAPRVAGRERGGPACRVDAAAARGCGAWGAAVSPNRASRSSCRRTNARGSSPSVSGR